MTDNFFFNLIGQTQAPFFLIAGPCVIENHTITEQIAATLKPIAEKLNIPFFFKASFDKANRSSQDSFRGPGLQEGLEILSNIKSSQQVNIISDIHSPEQAKSAAKVLDIIQIPAFLCRQTDLIAAAARTGKPINIKKGQFLSPFECSNLVAKAVSFGCKDVSITERGNSFGYNNLVVDFRSVKVMQDLGIPYIFDATHSVQLPGGNQTRSGGDSSFVPVLSRAAIAAGANGLFIETHPEPDKALCDGPNSLPLDQVEPLLTQLAAIASAINVTS
ncbi:MAG: 3-deoxy-8-phosphooctulonate synthase [Desulfobacteraceae bacterium]|nr:MAG: 3-deoxy-8-phosphooctulonate synthase [Desulfobacteraceae bacterium]